MADSKVFDVRFDFSMSKSPRGQVLSRFRWIGDGFIRVDFSKTFVFYPFMRSKFGDVLENTGDQTTKEGS